MDSFSWKATIKMNKLSVLLVSLCLTGAAQAEWATSRIAVHVGPNPSSTAPIATHLNRGEAVKVLQVQKGWARISSYREPKSEGLRGKKKVARWVSMRHLSEVQPAPLPALACEHPDIAPNALPKAGPGLGMTREEAAILCRGARHLLATDRCARVEYGDKSLSRPGAFFVNCGGPNLFFSEADLPDED